MLVKVDNYNEIRMVYLVLFRTKLACNCKLWSDYNENRMVYLYT